MSRTPSRRRTLLSRAVYVLFVLLLLLGVGELTVRWMGFQPWNPRAMPVEVQPGGSLFQPDSLLGYTGRPGTFRVDLDQRLQFTVTHDSLGHRITPAPPWPDSLGPRPEIWIFGCSFTHGYGVDDSATYPYLLQQALPDHRIRNFAMSAYGTYHAVLQLEEALDRWPTPQWVVLAYGDFHDQRNVNSRFWRKALSSQRIAAGIRYPYLRYAGEGTRRHLDPPTYRPWPGAGWSALVHYFEHAWNRREDRELGSRKLTLSLIRQVAAAADGVGARFLLAGILDSGETQQVLGEMAAEGLDTLDISADTDQPAYRILPDDPHPNARAHRQMAAQLTQYLQTHAPNPVP